MGTEPSILGDIIAAHLSSLSDAAEEGNPIAQDLVSSTRCSVAPEGLTFIALGPSGEEFFRLGAHLDRPYGFTTDVYEGSPETVWEWVLMWGTDLLAYGWSGVTTLWHGDRVGIPVSLD